MIYAEESRLRGFFAKFKYVSDAEGAAENIKTKTYKRGAV